LCLHLSFVPGTLVLNPSIVPNPDTSTVRAHCVRSVPTAVECFLRHRYMFFLPNYIFIERPRHIFLVHDDLYFYRETTDTYRTGVFVMGRSFTCSAANV
jgi:hypothetical protein